MTLNLTPTTVNKDILVEFINPAQLRCLRSLCRGEEGDYLHEVLATFRKRITEMPVTYKQDGLGDDAIAYLHYFKNGCDFHITEKDMGDVDEPGQHQAFGLANLGYGPELGYISIVELLENGVELDLHFTPTRIGDIKKARE